MICFVVALRSIQSLLTDPNPKDPQDAEVASLYFHRRPEFDIKAREWAVKYGNAPSPSSQV